MKQVIKKKMGPRGLNKFFKETNPNGIKEISLIGLMGKTIVVDVSIYLYRYNTNNELFENFYSMLTLFKINKITPLFIFDGKPPPEKYEKLIQRKIERKDAEFTYNSIMAGSSKKISKKDLEMLKRKKTHVTYNNIQNLKILLEHYGVMYEVAENEADELCASYVLNGKAWACLSDDMDMFIYGCPRILRYFSILNETVVLYDTEKILTFYNISFTDFKYICILSGTDYNERVLPIETLFNIYLNDKNNFQKKIVQRAGNLFKKVIEVYELYNLNKKHFNIINDITYKEQNRKELQDFLKRYDFIFIN